MKKQPPIEFAKLGLDVNSFHYSDEKSFRGACPRCGGHHRFVVFVDHPFPMYHGFCDVCGLKEKYWERFTRQPETKEAREQREIEYQREEADRIAKRVRLLKDFTDRDIAEENHLRMEKRDRIWWREQGIPDSLQDYWRLGYEQNYKYNSDMGLMVTPAYTIPYYHYVSGGDPKLLTMQYRLANTLNPNDRYRFAYGLGATYYTTDPYEPIRDICIICEGAKKAMNVSQIVDPNKISVIAQPSKSGDYGVVDAVKNCGRVFVIFDPDGQRNARDKAKQIGRAARVVELNDKIDDLIIAGRLDERGLEIVLRHSR